MGITIRDAASEDREFLAWVMLTAARSHRPICFWDYALPGPEAPRLETIADLTVAAKLLTASGVDDRQAGQRYSKWPGGDKE